MNAKEKLSLWLKMMKVVNAAKKAMRRSSGAKVAIKSAIRDVQKAVKSVADKNQVQNARFLPIPSKVGSVLPLIPIFVGLSAFGALTAGAVGVAKAINDASRAQQQLTEDQRYNKIMGAISL